MSIVLWYYFMHRFFESQRIFTSVIFLRNFITVRNVFGYSNYRDYVFSFNFRWHHAEMSFFLRVKKKKRISIQFEFSQIDAKKNENLWKLSIQKFDHCDRFFPSSQIDESDKFSFTWLQYILRDRNMRGLEWN